MKTEAARSDVGDTRYDLVIRPCFSNLLSSDLASVKLPSERPMLVLISCALDFRAT